MCACVCERKREHGNGLFAKVLVHLDSKYFHYWNENKVTGTSYYSVLEIDIYPPKPMLPFILDNR